MSIDYIEIEHHGYMYKIPQRDDIDDWIVWIEIWLNEGVSHQQVQRTVDRHVLSDSVKIRESKLAKILDENSNN